MTKRGMLPVSNLAWIIVLVTFVFVSNRRALLAATTEWKKHMDTATVIHQHRHSIATEDDDNNDNAAYASKSEGRRNDTSRIESPPLPDLRRQPHVRVPRCPMPLLTRSPRVFHKHRDASRKTFKHVYCMFDHYNTMVLWFRPNIAHQSQFLLPCITWLEEQRRAYPNDTDTNFGIILNPQDAHQPRRMRYDDWANQIIGAFGFCVRIQPFRDDTLLTPIQKSRQHNRTLLYAPNRHTLLYRPPNTEKAVWRRPTWWGHEQPRAQTTAWWLRRRLGLRDDDDGRCRNDDAAVIRIGIVVRPTRMFLYGTLLELLSKTLFAEEEQQQQRHAEVSVQAQAMEDLSPFQQAQWWNQQSIVIASHGAALSNIVYMRNGTSAVVEVFSPRFYQLDYFRRLSRSVGVHHLQWTDPDVSDHEREYRDLMVHPDRHRIKSADFRVPAHAVVELVREAYERIRCPTKTGKPGPG